MPDRSKRFLLWLMSGCFVFMGCGIATACILMEIKPPPASDLAIKVAAPKEFTQVTERKHYNELEFSYVWAKPLRRPLIDPVPEVPIEAKAVKPPAPKPTIRLDAKLIATLVDADPRFGVAWIAFRNQTQKLKVDEVIQGHPGEPRVSEIAHERIVVELQGKSHVLQLPKNDLLVSRQSS